MTLEALHAENLELKAQLGDFRFRALLASRFDLSPGQVRLLLTLFMADRPVSIHELGAHVQVGEITPGSNMISVLVCRLRSKLGPGAIETLARVGYRLADAARDQVQALRAEAFA
jgi:DNA-binding response OmpR family regulator